MDSITVKYKFLKQLVEALEEKGFTEDSDVSFEFIVGSCFPNILNNIKQELRKEHTLGFIEGVERNK